MKRWSKLLQRRVEVPEIDAFLAEIEEVCKKHNLDIAHEDKHGAFKIVTYGNLYGGGISSARDERDEEPAVGVCDCGRFSVEDP